MAITPVQELRRIAEAVGELRGQSVDAVEIRADCRQLRVLLEGGQQLLLTALVDENGKPRFDADMLRGVGDADDHNQLEVRFDDDGPLVIP